MVSVIHGAVSQLEPTWDDIDFVVLAIKGGVVVRPPGVVLPKPVKTVERDRLAVKEGGTLRKQQELII